MEQGVEQIEAEPDGHDQSNDRFNHANLLKPPQRDRVGAHQRQNRATKSQKNDIEHDCLLAGASPSAKRRKLSNSEIEGADIRIP